MADKFIQSIQEIRQRDAAMPRRIDINLAVAGTVELSIAGDLFYIWQSPDESSYVDVRINTTDQPLIRFVRMTGIKTPFDKLYITTPAGQTGTMTLIYATEAAGLMELIDNRSVTLANLAEIRDELRGETTFENYAGKTIGAAAVKIIASNVNRKGCCVQALKANTGLIYLGFDNTVTAGGAPGIWFAELQPGQSFSVDDYRGDIYAIGSAAGQIAGIGEW